MARMDVEQFFLHSLPRENGTYFFYEVGGWGMAVIAIYNDRPEGWCSLNDLAQSVYP